MDASMPPARAHGRCPICGAALGDAIWVCRHCDTPHHDDCARYFGGCAIFGCRDGNVPQPIEQASWPAAVTAMRRVALARHVQTAALITVIGLLAIVLPGLMTGLLSMTVARVLALPLVAAVIAYAGIDAIVIPVLAGLLEREMGASSRQAIELPRNRLHHAIPAVRNAASRFTWLDAAGTGAVVISLLLMPFLGTSAASLAIIGVMARVAADQLRIHVSEIEVALNRFEATHAPRLPSKPKA